MNSKMFIHFEKNSKFEKFLNFFKKVQKFEKKPSNFRKVQQFLKKFIDFEKTSRILKKSSIWKKFNTFKKWWILEKGHLFEEKVYEFERRRKKGQRKCKKKGKWRKKNWRRNMYVITPCGVLRWLSRRSLNSHVTGLNPSSHTFFVV